MPKTKQVCKRKPAQRIIETPAAAFVPPRPPRHFFDWRFFTVLIVLVGLSLSFAGFSRVIDPTKGDPAIGNKSLSLFQHIGQLVENQDQTLKGETDDRVNILLLGIGGEGHEGAYLADTIILVSLKPSTGQLAMLSIPRDFYVPIPGYNWRKINNASAFGRMDNYPGGGEQLTIDVISRVFNITIPYYARIDFSGFKKIVDDVGGITVDVEKSFIDREYPTENFGYQTISFQAGTQTMNGDTALKFVRSRKSTSDFDRSERQQQVLVAIRQKALGLGTLLNPVRISDVLTDLGTHTKTNLELWEMARLAGLIENLDTGTIVNRVLDSGADSPLKADSTPDGAYILRPKKDWDNWTELQTIARTIFNAPSERQNAAPTVIVQNGTRQVGLADRVAAALKRSGFDILRTENASVRTEPITRFYNLTGQADPAGLALLTSLMPAAAVLTPVPLLLDPAAIATTDPGIPPTSIKSSAGSRPDWLIILGSDNAANGLLNNKTPAIKPTTR